MKAKEKAMEHFKNFKIGEYKPCMQYEYDYIILEAIDIAIQETKKDIFNVFDKYACIKNDKWYLELKRKELGEKH